MAESQVLFPYSAADLAAIQEVISTSRFAPFRLAAGFNEPFAIGLYLYNARLAKSLLFPLHVTEVALRNGIDDILCDLFGPDWPNAHGLHAILTQESLDALRKAQRRVFADKGPNAPRGQIVAALTFDFWSNLFRPEYDRPLWQVNLRRLLPNLPNHQTRPDVQAVVKEINRLRNRIAHHEPILNWDVTDLHQQMVRLTNARCATTAQWMRHHSTLSAAIRTRPTLQTARRPTIGEICDSTFNRVRGDDSLSAALANYAPAVPALVRVNADGDPTAVIPAPHLLHHLAEAARGDGGLIDLNDHDIDAVVETQGLAHSWVGIDENEPLLSGITALQARGIKALVVTGQDAGANTIRGVIVRAHRRY